LIVYLGAIPFCVPKCRDSKQCLSFLNCFAAGIFFGMAFIHILPEADEMYTEYVTEELGYRRVFPLPYVLAFAGYLIILLIDRVLSQAHSHKDSKVDAEKIPDTSAISTNGADGADEDARVKTKKPSMAKQCCSGRTNKGRFTATFVLVLSLGVHSFFEGMVVGLLVTAESLL